MQSVSTQLLRQYMGASTIDALTLSLYTLTLPPKEPLPGMCCESLPPNSEIVLGLSRNPESPNAHISRQNWNARRTAIDREQCASDGRVASSVESSLQYSRIMFHWPKPKEIEVKTFRIDYLIGTPKVEKLSLQPIRPCRGLDN